MIVSASRRTDLAACYPEWLYRRLREGYALVPHPRDSRRLSRVSLSPEAVDCLVLWTKNPEPFLPYLDEVEQRYPFYFQFTLTPYGRDMEPGLPSKERLSFAPFPGVSVLTVSIGAMIPSCWMRGTRPLIILTGLRRCAAVCTNTPDAVS